MNNQEYEQKKKECWEEFCRANPSHNKSIFAKKTLEFAFDRAYALGKQTETIMQKEIVKAAEEYAEKAMEHVYSEEWDSEYVQGLIEASWYDGYTALGKQEKDADTVISGWMARDKNGDLVCCAGSKPFKEEKLPFWRVDFRNFIECIPNDLFPDLTWDSDPLPVEIIIKRKKNG